MKRLINPDTYLPIINGLIGDKLAEKKDSWAIPMSFRLNGKDISEEEALGRVKRKNVVILVHGLMADELVWKHFAFLQKNFAVLQLRYNTGLHISENGRAFANVLDRLHDRAGVKKLYLAGHSMGGLVIRSACYYGAASNHSWVKNVPAIFLLAVPNAGAVLEKVGHLTSSILNKIARWHTDTIGNLIDQRSNGIKDLRLAFMLDDDWQSPGATHTRLAVPPVPGIRYHILVGSVASDEKSLMAKYFGDGLVTQHSAIGTTLLKVSHVKVFPRTGHNGILNNPEVLKYFRKVLKV